MALCERHGQLGTQSTGRSAAVFLEGYGTHNLRLLTKASRAWFERVEDNKKLLRQRTMLTIGSVEQQTSIDAQVAACEAVGNSVEVLDEAGARALHPYLREGYVESAVADEAAFEIDVEETLQRNVRALRQAGGRVLVTHDVWQVERAGSWVIRAADVDGELTAGVLVNAAGSWGDLVAEMAGVTPIGLEPRRRTACTVLADDIDSSDLPLLVDADEQFYVKPEAGGFLYSPADATPSPPIDARPEELDVALALERVRAATTLPTRSIQTAWAGLRTFSPDGEIVLGPDPEQPDFLWCVGQGGTGIQTSPAAAAIVADHVTGVALSELAERLAPDRLRSATG